MTTTLPHELSKRLGEMVDELTTVSDEALTRLGWDAITLMLLRTKAGKDADGVDFVPYSESYAALKLRKGWSSTPTLTMTGQMLSGITPDISGENEVTLRFGSEFDARKASWNDPVRNFFDVRSEEELSILAESLLEQVGK